jgi:hypothetical protein
MIIEDSIDFFRTGQLANFPFGLEKRNVITLLGDTEEQIENEESSVLKYDRTEFYFYHHKSGMKYLNGIIIQPIPIPADKGNLEMNYSWLTKNLNYLETKKKLKFESIKFIETIESAEDTLVLRTDGKVDFLFLRDDNKICKIGRYLSLDELEIIINGG